MSGNSSVTSPSIKPPILYAQELSVTKIMYTFFEFLVEIELVVQRQIDLNMDRPLTNVLKIACFLGADF